MKYARMIITIIPMLFANAAFAEAEHVGIIVFVTGKVSATNTSHKSRALKRRAKIFNGDTLTTNDDSNIQVRFIDGAIISLRENTILKIDDYRYKPEEKEENSALSLLKGGFRTISGGIGKENYKVTTTMATIGIRGTHYEAVFDQGNLFIAAWDGGVKISNDGGDINLGLGAAYNFAQITHAESAPAGLSNPPSTFKRNYNTQAKSGNKKPPLRPALQTPPRQQLAEQPLPPPVLDVNSTIPAQRKISDINLNRIGIVAYSGVSRPKFFGGKAGYDAAGNPVITDNGLGPHEAGFETTAANIAFWKGNATTTNRGSKDYGNGYVVDWGIWDTSGGSSIRQNNPEGLAFETDIKSNIYWGTARQTPAATLASLTGSATYTTSASVGSVIGGGSGGTIDTSNFSFNANTNFDTGVVSGSMTISNGENWNVSFNGDPNDMTNGKGLVNGVLDVTIDKGASTVNSINGVKADMGIVVTGANAEAIVGTFDLEAYNTSTNIPIPTTHAEGVFVAEK